MIGKNRTCFSDELVNIFTGFEGTIVLIKIWLSNYFITVFLYESRNSVSSASARRSKRRERTVRSFGNSWVQILQSENCIKRFHTSKGFMILRFLLRGRIKKKESQKDRQKGKRKEKKGTKLLSVWDTFNWRELKQRRFWGTHVNRKWTFCILRLCSWTNFWVNRLNKS